MDAIRTIDGEITAETCQPDLHNDSPAMFPLTFRDAIDWFCLVQEAVRSQRDLVGDRVNDPPMR